MQSPQTTEKDLVYPLDRHLHAYRYDNEYVPKSFGSFFANVFYDHPKEFQLQYRLVCDLNKWNHSHFKSYVSMLRWMLSNNASREAVEYVLDMAYIHLFFLDKNGMKRYYCYEEEEFILNYHRTKYIQDGGVFDYSQLPKLGVAVYEFSEF